MKKKILTSIIFDVFNLSCKPFKNFNRFYIVLHIFIILNSYIYTKNNFNF